MQVTNIIPTLDVRQVRPHTTKPSNKQIKARPFSSNNRCQTGKLPKKNIGTGSTIHNYNSNQPQAPIENAHVKRFSQNFENQYPESNGLPNSLATIRTLNFNTMTNCRFTRPGSSYKDKVFNKYWDSTKDNTLGKKENKINLQSIKTDRNVNVFQNDLITNPIILSSQNRSDNSLFNRNLYKFNKIDWESKKSYNFLSTIGGLEVNSQTYLLSNQDYTMTTDFSSRPMSTKQDTKFDTQNNTFNNSNRNENLNFFNKRPVTSKEAHTSKNRLFSGKTKENTEKNLIIKDSNSKRPMTAINKPSASKFRPLSGKIEKNSNQQLLELDDIADDEDYVIDELIEDSVSHERQSQTEHIYSNKNNSNYDGKIISEDKSLSINKKYYPRVESLYRNFESIKFRGTSIKVQAADSDLLDIFDRSQRTMAATLAKVGDYEYYSAYQRIGSFMNFSMHLKWDDLKKIEERYNYTKNQPELLISKKDTKSLPENMSNSSLLSISQTMSVICNINGNFKRNPNWLFHGFMKYEADAEKVYLQILNPNSGKTYDPTAFVQLIINDRICDPSNWPQDFQNKIRISLNNFDKYLDSEKILISDLVSFESYDKKLKYKFISRIDFKLVKKYKNIVESNLKEIENKFYDTLKTVIMEYILRSPFERKRLNIQYLPKKSLPSSIIIANHGSFNRKLYVDWVKNYIDTQDQLNKNLSSCNIISSSLCDWTQNFQHVNLINLDNKFINKLISTDQGTIHVEDFFNNQNCYMKKSFIFLRDIYYRGTILITKKNKFLKRSLGKEGRWTFKGYINEKILQEQNTYDSIGTISHNRNYSSLDTERNEKIEKHSNNNHLVFYNDPFYCMDIDDLIEDFWSKVNYEDLLDIRVNPSYFVYITLLKKSKFDLSKNEYDILSQENKHNLNTSVSAYVTIFFRGIVEKTIQQLSNFILNYKLKDEIINSVKERHEKNFSTSYIPYDLNSEIFYHEKEIKMPNLRVFSIKEYVNPILSIKCKYDNSFTYIKLEYSYDQVSDFFIKLIDNTVTIFNNLLTAHHLQFKETPPSEYEKIQKEHWVRLNDIFTDKMEDGKPKPKVFSDDYFSNLCPNLILEEIKSKSNLNSSSNENYTKINSIKTYLRVGFPNDDNIINLKNKIIKHIKNHFIDMEESMKVFEPLKELYSNLLSDHIYSFLETINQNLSVGVDYNKFLQFAEKIRQYQKYISTIPNFISYSLMSIDTREIKADMFKKTVELSNNLFKSLEDSIIQLYLGCNDRYNKIYKSIDRRLYTPEDLVEMDKIKINMTSELNNISKDFEDAMKIYFFLFKVDHNFSEGIMSKTDETVKRHLRFKKEYDEVEKVHQRDRDILENKFREDKNKLESDISEFISNVNSLDSEIYIAFYDQVLEKIENNEKLIQPLKERITILSKDEELLFNYKLITFEEFDKILLKLNKFSLLWNKASLFYKLRKTLLENFSDMIDLTEPILVLKELNTVLHKNRNKLLSGEEIVLKMSKIVEDDIDVFREFLEVINEVIESNIPLDENLRGRVINHLDSKKLDTACKNILFVYFSKKT